MLRTFQPPSVGLSTLLLLSALLPFPSLPGASTLQAQESRLSLGYTLRNYRYSAEANPSFGGGTSALTKGALQVGYLDHFTRHLYLAADASYLLHEEGTFLHGGPVRFDGWDLSGALGVQWSDLGIFGALRVGRVEGIRARAARADGAPTWVPPSGSDGRWVTSLGGGIRYFVVPVLEAKAGVMVPLGAPDRIEMATGGAHVPAFRSAELNPVTVSLGLSLSIPFGGPDRRERGSGPSRGDLPEVEAAPGTSRFLAPLYGASVVTSPFGGRRGHAGVDLDADTGDPVRAAAAGRVVRVGSASGYGKMVKLAHRGGYTTLYAHLSEIRVRFGQEVGRGERIGRAGSSGHSTGSHLHFEVWRAGRPVDPERLLSSP